MSPGRAGETTRVLMVTGSYFPEITGGGLQCRSLVLASRSTGLRFAVVTTTAERGLPFADTVDNVPVYRLPLRECSAALQVALWLPYLLLITVRELVFCDVIHLHGISRKSFFFILLGRCLGRKVILKLTSLGEDDPRSICVRGGLMARLYRMAGSYLVPGEALRDCCLESGIERQRVLLLPNGVDTERFRPVSGQRKRELREKLGLPADDVIVMFAGHCSHDKRPGLLARAWSALDAAGVSLLLVGRSRPGSYEISENELEQIRRVESSESLPGRLVRVEEARRIELYFGAVDIFALPSVREGMPNALLEAMSCGLACAATRLEGITDSLLGSGAGMLFTADSEEELRSVLARLAGDAALRSRLGRNARETAEKKYSLAGTSRMYVEYLQHLTGKQPK